MNLFRGVDAHCHACKLLWVGISSLTKRASSSVKYCCICALKCLLVNRLQYCESLQVTGLLLWSCSFIPIFSRVKRDSKTWQVASVRHACEY